MATSVNHDGGLKPEVHLGAEAHVHIRALWVIGSRSAGVNVRLVERLQQPHEVGAVSLTTGGQESRSAGQVTPRWRDQQVR